MLVARFGVEVCADNHEAALGADLLLLCVEPQVLDEVLKELAPIVEGHPLVISVAAGYPMSRIQHYLNYRPEWCEPCRIPPSSIGDRHYGD